jgi:Family of unknown function (DUF6236)
MARIGLYYPYIHFRDEAWLKLASLYWSKIGRIVPRGYEIHDSDTVRRLIDELELVRNFDPAVAAEDVALPFVDLLAEHGGELRKQYDPWQEPPAGTVVPRPRWLPAERHPHLAYIATEKLSSRLRQAMLDTGLVIEAPSDRGSMWMGMHPRLAAVYMTALAKQMAKDNQFEVVTSSELDHLAVGDWSMPRLAQALLEDTQLVGSMAGEQELPDQLGMVAIQAVVPRNLEQVPLEKIIEIRKNHGDELSAFREHLEGLGETLKKFETVKDPGALQLHLEVYYEDTLKRDLKRLKEGMTSVGVDTAMTAMNTQVVVPAAVSTSAGLLHATLNPIIAAGAAIAFGAAKVLRSRRERQQQLSSSPAAYLLRLEEGLQPATLLKRVQRSVRKFMTGF